MDLFRPNHVRELRVFRERVGFRLSAMNTAQAHYDQLLGSVYTWMTGGFDAVLTGTRQLLDLLDLAS